MIRFIKSLFSNQIDDEVVEQPLSEADTIKMVIAELAAQRAAEEQATEEREQQELNSSHIAASTDEGVNVFEERDKNPHILPSPPQPPNNIVVKEATKPRTIKQLADELKERKKQQLQNPIKMDNRPMSNPNNIFLVILDANNNSEEMARHLPQFRGLMNFFFIHAENDDAARSAVLSSFNAKLRAILSTTIQTVRLPDVLNNLNQQTNFWSYVPLNGAPRTSGQQRPAFKENMTVKDANSEFESAKQYNPHPPRNAATDALGTQAVDKLLADPMHKRAIPPAAGAALTAADVAAMVAESAAKTAAENAANMTALTAMIAAALQKNG